MGILTGNYKDEGTGVAASIGALALSAAFREPLLSEADVVPALRRAAIQAHDDIFAFGQAELGDYEFATVMGRRSSMKGLGASLTAIAITDTKLFGLHIGEGRAFLMRDGTTRKLVLEHTLGHAAAHKEAVRRGEGIPGAEWVVLKVLGLSAELPVFDVFRVDVRPGDRVVVGSMTSLADEMLGDGALATLDAEAMTQALARGMSTHFPFAPATVGVISSN